MPQLPSSDVFPVEGEQITDVERWRSMFRLARETGVVEDLGSQLEVIPAADQSSAPTVTVGTGEAWIEGHFARVAAATDVALDAASLDDPRIDLIVLRIEPGDAQNNGYGELAAVKGTAAASPSAPAATQEDDGVWELPLAEVTVPAATGEITASEIDDRRAYSQVVGGISFVSTAERDALDTYPGRVVYNVDENRLEVYNPELDAWEGGQRPVTFVADDAARDALSPYDGQVVFVVDKGAFDVYDPTADSGNGAWRTSTPADGASRLDELTSLDAAGGEITGLADGTAPDSAATVGQLGNATETLRTSPVERSGKDSEGIFTVVEYNRADGTRWKRSELSGGTSPEYAQRTVTLYEDDGTTVLDTVVYDLSYDGDGDLTGEAVA